MNIAKHMEIIFIAAIALISASTLAHAAAPSQRSVSATAQMRSSSAMPTMAVVTITAKRLSPAQKAALGN